MDGDLVLDVKLMSVIMSAIMSVSSCSSTSPSVDPADVAILAAIPVLGSHCQVLRHCSDPDWHRPVKAECPPESSFVDSSADDFTDENTPLAFARVRKCTPYARAIFIPACVQRQSGPLKRVVTKKQKMAHNARKRLRYKKVQSPAAMERRLAAAAETAVMLTRKCDALNRAWENNVFVCRYNPHLICGAICRFIHGGSLHRFAEDPRDHDCSECLSVHASLKPLQYQASPARRGGNYLVL